MYEASILKDMGIPKKYGLLLSLCKHRYNNLTGHETPYLSASDMATMTEHPVALDNAKSCIEQSKYKRNYPYVIHRKTKNGFDFYISALVLYGILMIQNQTEPVSAKNIKAAFNDVFSDLDENYIFRFSLSKDYPSLNGVKINEFFLVENDFSIKDLYNKSPEKYYIKKYIKSLTNLQ